MNWNLLYGIPGDRDHWYAAIVDLIPLLEHLNPPTGLFHLSVDRFSPYFQEPEAFGLSNIRPIPSYDAALPTKDITRLIAFHFIADYTSETRAGSVTIKALDRAIAAWRASWMTPDRPLPLLELAFLGDNNFLLVDTRSIASATFQFIDETKARVAIAGDVSDDDAVHWALASRCAVEFEGRVLPLAVAAPEQMRRFNCRRRLDTITE
ncbi:MAG: hypothetical protein IT577_05645 [Verrucomicrobiae bacterium]|nr:hypothetical protein [Verrucomicrobiae bacterium]